MENQNVVEEKNGGRRPKKRIIITIIIVAVAIAACFDVLCFTAFNETCIYPNVYIDGINVGGMSKEAAVEHINSAIEAKYSGKSLTVNILDTALDISVEDIDAGIYAEEAVEAAYGYGRQGTLFGAAFCYGKALLLKTEVETDFYCDMQYITEAVARAADETDVRKEEYSYKISEDKIVITKGITGYQINQEELCGLIVAAFENMDFTPINYEPAADEPEDIDLDALYEEVYVEAEDARFDDETSSIVESVVGISFDVQKARRALLAAEDGEKVTIELIQTMPETDTQTLEELLFRDVLAESTTYLSSNYNRTSNVQLAAQIINGTILGPDEIFSLNDAVGKRTAERGFLPAPAYLLGEVVEEIGGGVCQVSSTIYLTALKADMEIVERTNHSFIVYYVPYGQDATVSWGGPEFKFQNNTGYPLKIEAIQTGGSLTIRLYGTATEEKTVKMTCSILSTTPFETIEEEDPTLPVGTTKVKTTGSTGYVVETYRNVYDGDGNLISSTFEARSVYKKRDKVVLVGTMGAEEALSPEDTETPEETPETSPEAA